MVRQRRHGAHECRANQVIEHAAREHDGFIDEIVPLALPMQHEKLAPREAPFRQRQDGDLVEIMPRLPQAQGRRNSEAEFRADETEQQIGGIELVSARTVDAQMPREAIDLLADDRARRIADQRQFIGERAPRRCIVRKRLAALGLPTDVSLTPYSVERFATGALLTGKYGVGAVS